ncbi:hypothetical protein Agub_g13354 [Astrephomene gubernaculifera]|uniref:Tetratricopeptide SHNi-TPR domain-containing protein n=1 Tax=Astrephomene gubernaculifera TaxID=47775 RepID=A0AAD3E206_9CHLO|nr:hypothetical protein Agub_g13354 [Astrephomene gubernaculifera]
MATEVASAVVEVSPEDLERAIANLNEGKKMIDEDPEKAVELLCSALRVYEKRYGSEALECADVYLYYGIALYEVARVTTDALGSTKTTVAPLPDQKPASEGAATEPSGTDANAQEQAAPDAPNAEKQGAADAEMTATAPADAEAAVPAAKEDDKPAAAPTEGETTAPAATESEAQASAPATEEKPATEGETAAAPAPATGDEAKKEGEEGAEGEEGSDEEEGEGGAEEGGEAQADDEEAAADGDDMKLAWEMLELARLIYSKHQPEQHHSKLAEVHKSLGDITSEQERFEEAVDSYKQSLEHLQAMQPPSLRRIAEVQYKLSLALTYQDQPEEALKETQAAITSLEAAVAETEEKLAALPTDGSGGEAAEEEGRQLQATSDDLRGVLTELQGNCEGLKETIANNNSIKETLKQAFIKANSEAGDAAAAGTTSGSFSAPSVASMQAVLLGVVGRGTKRITLQPTVAATTQTQIQQPPAAAAGANAAAPAKRTLSDLQSGQTAGAAAAGGAADENENEVAAKKARTEEAAGKTESAAPAAAGEVTMEGQ